MVHLQASNYTKGSDLNGLGQAWICRFMVWIWFGDGLGVRGLWLALWGGLVVGGFVQF